MGGIQLETCSGRNAYFYKPQLSHPSGKKYRALNIYTVLILLNQTVNDGVAHSKNPRKCAYHVTFDLDLEHTLEFWMQAYLETIVCKFGRDRAICLGEGAICAKVYRQTDGQTDDGRLAIV